MQRFIPGFAFACTLSVVMLANVACASMTTNEVASASVAPDGTQQVTISAVEGTKLQPAAVSVHAGQPLQLALRNADQSTHDLTLSEGVAEPVKLTVNDRVSGAL